MNVLRRHHALENGGVARTDHEFKAVALGIKLIESFAAKLLDEFGRRNKTGEEALADLNGERGERGADLFTELFVNRGEPLKKSGLQQLHLGAEIDDLLVREIAGGVPTLLVAGGAGGEQFGRGVLKDGVARGLHGDERPVEGDELMMDGHVDRRSGYATMAASPSPTVMAPSSSRRRTTWMIASWATSTSLRRTGPSMAISSRKASAPRLEIAP
jgi:hypothetical protein